MGCYENAQKFQKFSIDTFDVREYVGVVRPAGGGLYNVGMQKLTMRLSDMRYVVCNKVESFCKTITQSFSFIS